MFRTDKYLARMTRVTHGLQTETLVKCALLLSDFNQNWKVPVKIN
jgi:hypothetical protein